MRVPEDADGGSRAWPGAAPSVQTGALPAEGTRVGGRQGCLEKGGDAVVPRVCTLLVNEHRLHPATVTVTHGSRGPL